MDSGQKIRRNSAHGSAQHPAYSQDFSTVLYPRLSFLKKSLGKKHIVGLLAIATVTCRVSAFIAS